MGSGRTSKQKTGKYTKSRKLNRKPVLAELVAGHGKTYKIPMSNVLGGSPKRWCRTSERDWKNKRNRQSRISGKCFAGLVELA